MEISQLTGQANVGAVSTDRSAAGLSSDDFFKLLISQLTNQDPLEPTSNDELLRQISSIRDIELSTTLTESLRELTGQQQFGSASMLIGQYVRGLPDEDGMVQAGVVNAIRFDGTGKPVLQLSNGAELPMDGIATIESPARAAEALIGRTVLGLDRRIPSAPEPVDGLVTAVRAGEGGEFVLELDTGDDLRLSDVISAGPAAAS